MKDWKYILYIGIPLALFVVLKLLSPRQFNWTETYAADDRNPFGTYVLQELLPGIFNEKDIRHSYETIYEIKDSLKQAGNLLIIAQRAHIEKADADALLRHVNQGGKALIAARYFTGYLADSLGIDTSSPLNDLINKEGGDTTALHLTGQGQDTTQQYRYNQSYINTYFTRFDSTHTTVVARDADYHPVTIRIQWGKGYIILNTTPLVFTNIAMLHGNNQEFIARTLSYLPAEGLQWTEYYHMGRLEAATPLRFILRTESLRWAYYITMAALLLYMAFEMKRRQRIIPIIKPLANTTLEFVSTIGNLYYQQQDHKNIAHKKIQYLLEHIRSHYWLNTTHLDDQFIHQLSRKSGKSEAEVMSLVSLIVEIETANQISAQQLTRLNEKIEAFYLKS